MDPDGQLQNGEQPVSNRLTLPLALFYPEDGGDTFFRNVGSYKTAQCHIPEDGILNTHCCENLKFYNY
jgi:hypothetical protein